MERRRRRRKFHGPLIVAVALSTLALVGCASSRRAPDRAPSHPGSEGGEAEEAREEAGSRPDGVAPPEAQDVVEGSRAAMAEVERLSGEIQRRLVVSGGVEEGGAGGGGANCGTVCDSSDAICASSSRICEIAQRYPAEAYFADRCGWSREECNEAGAACVECSK